MCPHTTTYYYIYREGDSSASFAPPGASAPAWGGAETESGRPTASGLPPDASLGGGAGRGRGGGKKNPRTSMNGGGIAVQSTAMCV